MGNILRTLTFQNFLSVITLKHGKLGSRTRTFRRRVRGGVVYSVTSSYTVFTSSFTVSHHHTQRLACGGEYTVSRDHLHHIIVYSVTSSYTVSHHHTQRLARGYGRQGGLTGLLMGVGGLVESPRLEAINSQKFSVLGYVL